jgi:hypothetical protein
MSTVELIPKGIEFIKVIPESGLLRVQVQFRALAEGTAESIAMDVVLPAGDRSFLSLQSEAITRAQSKPSCGSFARTAVTSCGSRICEVGGYAPSLWGRRCLLPPRRPLHLPRRKTLDPLAAAAHGSKAQHASTGLSAREMGQQTAVPTSGGTARGISSAE